MDSELSKQHRKLKDLLLLCSLFLIAMETVYCYELKTENLYINDFLKILQTIFSKLGIYNRPFIFKTIIICLSIFFISGKTKIKEIKHKKIFLLVSVLLFLGTPILLLKISPYAYLGICIMVYFLMLQGFKNMVLKINVFHFKNNDQKNLKNKLFQQMTRKIENPISFNIPYKFIKKYKNNMKPIYEKGWINIVEPRRAIAIMGKPGSGKSYSFNEEILRQSIKKGFAIANYDFKFPTLTNIAYNYAETYKQHYKKIHHKELNFVVINIDDPRYSHRLNPISPHLIKQESEAADAVYTIFYNIDKKSTQKPDFFLNSAMSLVTATLWFLKIYARGKYLSLPHIIEFILRPDEQIIKILCDYQEVVHFISAFKDAFDKKAFNQLAGMTASARVPLSKLVSDNLYYVMTDSEGEAPLDLRINLPEKPTIMNIANNPETQKSNSPALGLYMSQLVKVINKQGRIPCNFHIDELPTIYINGLDNLIATARSNNVCTTLAFQDYTQLVRDYGKETADAIMSTVGTVISGAVDPNTGRKIKEMLGKGTFETINESYDKEGGKTFSKNRSRDFIVQESDIAQMPQGEFVGLVADNFTNKLPINYFRGLVSPDKSDLGNLEIGIIQEKLVDEKGNLKTEALKENRENIRKEIDNLIKNELKRIEGDGAEHPEPGY